VLQRLSWPRLAAAALALLATAAVAETAQASSYGPGDAPGPALSVPLAQLQRSLRCTGDLGSTGAQPVLFVPPTLVNPDEAYFAFERALTAMQIPYCTVTIPYFTTEDIQVSAEYTVYAVRTIFHRTGQRVQVIGWSQGGGPEPRWALRFWPDIRSMVGKLIDIEAPNHGTVVIRYVCSGNGAGAQCINALCPGLCVPALWQQADNSNFTAALNSGQETFPGIAYTNIYSHTSQFVQPNLNAGGTTSLHGGGGQIANIATQDICPLNTADHLAYYYDPVGYAIVIDALTHGGPAAAARIDRTVCTQASNPYEPVSDIPTYSAHLVDAIFVNRLNQEPRTSSEPPLKCYVTLSCPVAGSGGVVSDSTRGAAAVAGIKGASQSLPNTGAGGSGVAWLGALALVGLARASRPRRKADVTRTCVTSQSSRMTPRHRLWSRHGHPHDYRSRSDSVD
jgi:LPXTG-motif cell wall-anchored protein